MSLEKEFENGSVALCLTGGGAAGAMFQVGALAALEDRVPELSANEFSLYVGTSSGACVATAVAGGQSIQRVYRALLDPGDDYFPLERRHVLQMDLKEWRRTATTALRALGQGSRSVFSGAESARSGPWQELSRLYDSLPAGMFSLEGYESFFAAQLERRGVSNHFPSLPKPLRIIAHDLETGEPTVFGSSGWDHVPISRACIASMAMPPLFSPVQIGGSNYFDPAPSQLSHIDLALSEGAKTIIVVNSMVPLKLASVPTGHGEQRSLRDKGAMWVGNQANRIKVHRLLWEAIERVRAQGTARVLVLEPEPTDGTLFLHNAADFGARRTILEFAYRHAHAVFEYWVQTRQLDHLPWTLK